MLGASNTLIMLSTGISGIVSMFLLIPASCIVDKLGPRKVVNISCGIACVSYLIMSAAPLFGTAARYVVLFGCISFCVSKPLWTASWYPILGDILKTSERGDFLGFMRFSYYILSGSVFFLLGLAMGKKPPVWLLQLTVGVTGILVLGRSFFISRTPRSGSHGQSHTRHPGRNCPARFKKPGVCAISPIFFVCQLSRRRIFFSPMCSMFRPAPTHRSGGAVFPRLSSLIYTAKGFFQPANC